MRKISRKGLVKKLDIVVSKVVRSRGYCVKCGKKNNLQAAHIFTRSNRAVRFSLNNILCLCAGCHFWGHKNPILFTEWVHEWLGDIEYEKLKIQARTIKKWTLQELIDLYERFIEIRDGK